MLVHATFSVLSAIVAMTTTKKSVIFAAYGLRTKYLIESLFFMRMVLVPKREMTLGATGGGGKGSVGMAAVVHGKLMHLMLRIQNIKENAKEQYEGTEQAIAQYYYGLV